jgi:cytolysin-activating lysine-acyltransferase
MASTQPPAGAKAPTSPVPPTAPTSSSAARQDRMAQSFANVVAVLMRDPGFRNLRLSDLEWLVLPPIMSGQWRLGQSRTKPEAATVETAAGAPQGEMPVVPTAVALWATVSPEIDRRLSANLEQPLLLKPHEWATGDILWLIAVAGDPRAVPKFLKQLTLTEFNGREVKMRVNGDDGKVVIRSLGQHRES